MNTTPTQQELKSGKQFLFNNENHQIMIGDDDIRSAMICFDGEDSGLPSWGHGFKIWFNGALIHSCKTFKSLESRLGKLIEKWNLEPCLQEETMW